MKICVYVEGGGPSAKSQTATACRKAFHIFFEKVMGEGAKPRVVASGSRDETYHDFCKSLDDPGTLSVLLVDSEGPVGLNKTAIAYLKEREKHWTRLNGDDHVHLMVQCMESWFLADPAVLQQYFGAKFKSAALSGDPKSIEKIEKSDVFSGLVGATKRTPKGSYHKTKHGFDLLGLIDPNLVRNASPFADRLLTLLVDKTTD